MTRNARRLRVLVSAVLGASALLYLFARIGLDTGAFKVAFGEHRIASPMSAYLSDAGMVLMLIALIRLIQMLRLLESGEVFSVSVVRRFRGFAFWLMLSALVGFAGPLVLALTGIGHGAVRLVLDFRQLLILAITSLLFLLARLFERGRALEEESREFV